MVKGTRLDLRNLFRKRRLAYHHVFNKDNRYTKEVLMDLAKFCRAHESTFNQDPRVQSNLDGRREVWLRIQENLELSNEEVYALHGVKDEQG